MSDVVERLAALMNKHDLPRAAARLYLEDVVHDDAGIEDAVLELSGRRPRGAGSGGL